MRHFALSLLLLALLGVGIAFDDRASYYATPLKTLKDCGAFANEKIQVAKCDVYWVNDTFALDLDGRATLPECAKLLLGSKDGTIPTIFYHVREVENFTEPMLRVMYTMNAEAMNYVDLVPEVNYYIWNKATYSQVAKGLRNLYADLALAVAEEEDVSARYNQEFFDSLNRSTILTKASVQYLVLNGWHVRNMEKPPVLTANFLQLYSGLVIRVKPEKAHLISKEEAIRPLREFFMPTIFDMPGSPDKSKAPLSVRATALLLVVMVSVSGLATAMGV